MASPLQSQYLRLQAPLRVDRPILAVVVDTEEEFDWHKPFDRHHTSVAAVDEIDRFQDIFDSYGVRPVYAIDYPVADSDRASAILAKIVADGRAEVGAQLHTWVNPPHAEKIDNFSSYQGNLSAGLEAEKLECLADRIRERFDRQVLIHKAGRYGFGRNTLAILERLGFLVDMSATPAFDFSDDGGPNYLRFPDRIGWLGRVGGILEVPNSGGFVGALARRGNALFEMSTSPAGRSLHAAGVLARLRLVERIRLSPEGHNFEAMKRFTQQRLGVGQDCFVVSLHSPSSMVGGTPYVTTVRERDELVLALKRYLAFFLGELNGVAMTPLQLRALILEQDDRSSAAEPGGAEQKAQ